MNTPHPTEMANYVEQHAGELLAMIEDLIRIPSENRSPQGDEAACQRYIAGRLSGWGYDTDIYEPDMVEGLLEHPLTTPARSYRSRPNVAARRKGNGSGRSLILSGHVDTVPSGTLPWTCDPFSAKREGNRLYGRGSNDMKAGIGINLFVMQALSSLPIDLGGDVIFESVVDEEFGGVNGTLAGRLRGYVADGAVLTEPSSLRICAGQRGGRTAHLLFTARGGVLSSESGAGVVEQLTCFLTQLPQFAAQRRAGCERHPLYAACADPVPVTVTKITTGPWGTGEPITVPEEARVELFWQMMPGERQEDVDREFFTWLDAMIAGSGSIFARRPEVSFAVRWLPGSAIDGKDSLCQGLQNASRKTIGKKPDVVGIEGPCDLFVFHEFGMPAVLWGPRGGQTHGSDEFVEVDSVIEAATVLLEFVCDWCGRAA